jgi:hypothetical protein
MSFISQSQRTLVTAVAGLLVVVLSVSAQANPIPALVVSLTDTTARAGDTSAWISVYLANYQDTLAGLTMQLLLDRPDLIEFKTDVEDTTWDTTWWECIEWYNGQCTDSQAVDPPIVTPNISSGAVDTTGTLISGWEYVTARSLSEERHDIKVTAIADQLGPPYTPGIYPQTSSGLLFRLNVRIYENIPEDEDSTVVLYIITSLSETTFSDPHGDLIGTITNYNTCDTTYCESWDITGDSCLTELLDTIPAVYDTMLIDTFYRYWICQSWGQDSMGEDSCLEWGNYSDPDSALNADSISTDHVPWTVWDTTAVFFTNGSLSVVIIECDCGDANNDNEVDVGDAVFLINYIFRGGPPPANPSCADVNNHDGSINVGDVVYLISYIFKGGAPPACGL